MIMTHTRLQSGFTLLEMVIILGIIGALIGTFLSFYQPLQTAQSNADTKQRVDRVMNAVSSFALRNNFLPCPANPTDNPTSGIASAPCGGTGVMGIVPYVTLGLTQEDAQDGFGRYFTYIVHGPATTPQGTAADRVTSAGPPAVAGSYFCSPPMPGNAMTIRRNSGVESNRAVIVLIAYGPDGYGAYNMTLTDTSQRNRPIGDGTLDNLLGNRERLNAVDQTGSVDQTDIADYVLDPTNTHFDDYVSYMTLDGVIGRLGVTGCH